MNSVPSPDQEGAAVKFPSEKLSVTCAPATDEMRRKRKRILRMSCFYKATRKYKKNEATKAFRQIK